MLKIISEVNLKRAIDAERGNVQAFLENLLTEVLSENYRYFISEHLSFREHDRTDFEASSHCWPPLLSNESQVSGLFAMGLSRVCPISRPEHPITRAQRARDGEDELVSSKSGRIDYLAYYVNRHIALELKRCPISTIGQANAKKGLASRWRTVSDQAKQALVHMRTLPLQYDAPVSIGLLAIRVSRKVTVRMDVENARIASLASLQGVVGSVKKLTSADFLAYYISPTEMQVSYGWGKEENQYRVFPGVIFAAVVHGSTK